MSQIVVTTAEELRAIVEEAVKSLLPDLGLTPNQMYPEMMSAATARTFLVSKGMKVSLQYLYKLSMEKKIPTVKVGSALWFKKSELEYWLNQRTVYSGSAQNDAIQLIAKSARNHVKK